METSAAGKFFQFRNRRRVTQVSGFIDLREVFDNLLNHMEKRALHVLGCRLLTPNTETRKAHMNPDTPRHPLPPLVGPVLTNGRHYLDNLLASAWKSLHLNQILLRAGFRKRHGLEVTETVFVLMVWKWLNVSSVAMFCRDALGLFSRARKDVLYDFLKREDVNWRGFHLDAAREVYRRQGLDGSRVKAFVLDDSVKGRRGRKTEGVSSHYDHMTNRHVMGQQVLTLGLATEEAFLPLDSQVYVSQKKAQGLNRPYRDSRSIAARRYREATTRGKPQMGIGMMRRAKRRGLGAEYLVADAWFGTKTMIRAAYELEVCAVLRMKKGSMRYRVTMGDGEKRQLDAKQLYAREVKRRWRKVRGLPWRAVSVEGELEVSAGRQEPPEWKSIQLLFVRGVNEPGEPEVGKKDWALFLCTDAKLAMSKMLEVYALRWGIEVYFKEAKQHLGFLGEQTRTFASHTASIHLCAIRYLMLVHAKRECDSARIGEVRAQIQDRWNALRFAGRLWQLFRAIISGTLDELGETLGCAAETLMTAIDDRVNRFFERSLQLDVMTMRLEFR